MAVVWVARPYELFFSNPFSLVESYLSCRIPSRLSNRISIAKSSLSLRHSGLHEGSSVRTAVVGHHRRSSSRGNNPQPHFHISAARVFMLLKEKGNGNGVDDQSERRGTIRLTIQGCTDRHWSAKLTVMTTSLKRNNHRTFMMTSSAAASTYSFLWPNNTQEASFVDHLLENEEVLNWTYQIPTLCLEKDAQVLGKGTKVVEPRLKKGSSVSLIKGQWTNEEDRKLLKLVKKHGVTKWS